MEIILQRKLSWLDPVPSDIMKNCNQLNLVSQEGQATSIPVQLLAASSPLLNSILTMPSSSCESITASISIPSATSSALHLLAQILSMGETHESGGLETTVANMNELQSIFTLLEMNVLLCPKLSSFSSKLAIESVDNVVAAARDEVLKFEDTQFKEFEVQNHVGLLIKKKSTTKKHSSSGKYRQGPLLKKRENMIRKLSADKKYVEKSCEDFYPSCSDEQRCDNVKFKQSGLLQDFKVNLVECSSDGMLKEDAMCKLNAVNGDRSVLMCNLCGVEVNKFVGLRRHYRDKHGIQDEKSTSKVIKPSLECSSDGTLKEDAMSKTNAAYGEKSLLMCNLCGVEVNKLVGLRRHYREKHGIEDEKGARISKVIKPSVKKCHKCDKRFSSRSSLLNHLKRVHKSDKLTGKCAVRKVQNKEVSEECIKTEVLSNDILSKRDERNECDTSSDHNHSLSMPKRRVHECQTYKPFGCDECDLSYKYETSLRRHRESIHEGKTYGCGVCDKVAAYKDGLWRHCNSSGHDKDLMYVIVDLP